MAIPDFQTAKTYGDVQQHVSPYGQVDGTVGINVADIREATKGAMKQFYIAVPGGGDVKVTNLDGITCTVKFQDGVNAVPITEVVADPGNPNRIDLFY